MLECTCRGVFAGVCLVCVAILCVFSLVCVWGCTVGVYGVCADPVFYGMLCVYEVNFA